MRVCITGANGALGSAVTDRFRADGHRVAGLQRSGPEDASNGRFSIGDLSDPGVAKTGIARAVDYLGGLDALVHLVGAFRWRPVAEVSLDDWRDLARVNVETAVAAVQASIPFMVEGGSIVLIGAASAEPAGPGMAAYASAKSGVARLAQSLAAEMKPQGVRVNAILPAIIDTPANRRDMADADFSAWTSPEAIADTLLFLCGPQSRAISGALIPVTHAA